MCLRCGRVTHGQGVLPVACAALCRVVHAQLLPLYAASEGSAKFPVRTPGPPDGGRARGAGGTGVASARLAGPFCDPAEGGVRAPAAPAMTLSFAAPAAGAGPAASHARVPSYGSGRAATGTGDGRYASAGSRPAITPGSEGRGGAGLPSGLGWGRRAFAVAARTRTDGRLPSRHGRDRRTFAVAARTGSTGVCRRDSDGNRHGSAITAPIGTGTGRPSRPRPGPARVGRRGSGGNRRGSAITAPRGTNTGRPARLPRGPGGRLPVARAVSVGAVGTEPADAMCGERRASATLLGRRRETDIGSWSVVVSATVHNGPRQTRQTLERPET
ncbi:hypothetical protein STVIR_1977 [Streptomyces viridochromogenes Tue57]|uniref:Uncharacterized protein n=1 Tax=Streptomyces viridochromogenes Tue57 TaxID=1160705 RepID=L8PNW0_STRVR|nr:hypothetical protein STVIR_1977 [Streptomyces viridochromogenes Tue57]